MNANLNKVKESIISLGIKKSELQKIMDEIFVEQMLGEPCLECSEKTNVQHFKEDGFKIHSCPKCPFCILEFSFHVSSKKQKQSLGNDDGLHLRGKRAGIIDEYLYFVCCPSDTIELRSKDIANIKVPFRYSGSMREKKCKNDEALCHLESIFNKLIQGVEECNVIMDAYYKADPKNCHYFSALSMQNDYLENYNSRERDIEKEHLDPAYKEIYGAIESLEEQSKRFDEGIELLSNFGFWILFLKIKKIENELDFYFKDTCITNENTNVEYKLEPRDIRNAKILQACISKVMG